MLQGKARGGTMTLAALKQFKLITGIAGVSPAASAKRERHDEN
jgi:hypothetical protein